MAHAQYRIALPTHDNLGNELHPDLPRMAHDWLHKQNPKTFEGSWVEGPHTGNWATDKPEGFHHLMVIAHDRPETDGIVKQLGAHIGQLANQWGTFIVKHGVKGPEPWIIDNPEYQEGQPASNAALPAPVAPVSQTPLANTPLEAPRASLSYFARQGGGRP